MVDVEATGDVESDWESESESKWSEPRSKKSKLQELEPDWESESESQWSEPQSKKSKWQELEPEEKEDIGVST